MLLISFETLIKADKSGNQLPINFKRLLGLKITLVKFTYLKDQTGRFLLCPIHLAWCDLALGSGNSNFQAAYVVITV